MTKHKLDDGKVVEIRLLRGHGAPGRILAHMYGVSLRRIYSVCSSERRKRLPTVKQLKEAHND